MKKRYKVSALIVGLMLIGSSGAISANALEDCPQNIQAFCNSSNPSVLTKGDCSVLDSIDINSLIEKCGTNSADIQNIINKGNCNSNDIQCLINNGTCSSEDLKCLIDKCGLVPDNSQCVDCGNEEKAEESEQNNDVSAPISIPQTNTASQSNVSEYEKEVVNLVNEIRVQNGLSPLNLNVRLCETARMKSQDMKDKGYFSHTSPTYGSPFDMMKQFGISYRTAGENIAMGQQTPQAVVNAWMNSEGHRANILNASFTEIGVGYVADGNYWTQMFIG